MTLTGIIVMIVVGIIVDIFIMMMNHKQEKVPFLREWSLDEGVTSDDEYQAASLVKQYCTEDVISLPDSFFLHKSIRDFCERYSKLEFDDYTMDYDRKELFRGEETEGSWNGFYSIGGDGGEISFYVRKSTDDEKIYAFDMEGSVCPQPYASNIKRFIVMRHRVWRDLQILIEEKEKRRK